jgi:murein L,D-transpeptidase YafK
MREKGIEKITNPKIIVERDTYKLNLYSNDILVKQYRAAFGKNPERIKTSDSDFVTPSGEYTVCRIDSVHRFYKFLLINYPNEKDAAEAFKQNYIDEDELRAIIIAADKNECPPEETSLGARIGIHGIGEYNVIFKNLPFSFNWTNGSVAVSNESMDELFSVIKIGTPVIISY